MGCFNGVDSVVRGGAGGGDAEHQSALHGGMLLRLRADQDFHRQRVQEGVCSYVRQAYHQESVGR